MNPDTNDSADVLAWLQTVEFPPGPLVVLLNEGNAPYATIDHVERWREMMQLYLQSATGHVRRSLLLHVARVRERLRLGRPLTNEEWKALSGGMAR